MKVIIAGSRDIQNYSLIVDAVEESGFSVTHVISGGASGVDQLGEQYAINLHLNLTIFEADWEQHGRSAGPRRNKQMASEADALVAIWDGKSKGTKNMIELARKFGLKVYVKTI
jgi:predicted Rossmann fold nucleotide-binding protein DprA/Smf involved in DNA uptake